MKSTSDEFLSWIRFFAICIGWPWIAWSGGNAICDDADEDQAWLGRCSITFAVVGALLAAVVVAYPLDLHQSLPLALSAGAAYVLAGIILFILFMMCTAKMIE